METRLSEYSKADYRYALYRQNKDTSWTLFMLSNYPFESCYTDLPEFVQLDADNPRH